MTQTRNVIARASRLFDLSERDITGDSRFAFIVRVRFAVYKALRIRGYSLSHIGRELGNRRHDTVRNGLARAEMMMREDPTYAARVAELAAYEGEQPSHERQQQAS